MLWEGGIPHQTNTCCLPCCTVHTEGLYCFSESLLYCSCSKHGFGSDLHSCHSDKAVWLEKLALSPILHSICLVDIQNYFWLQLIKTYFLTFVFFNLTLVWWANVHATSKNTSVKIIPIVVLTSGRRQLEKLVFVVGSGLDRIPHCWLWYYQIKIASPFQRNKKTTHRLPSSAWQIPFLLFLLSNSWKFPFQKAISHFGECILWRMIALLE